jgi:hypothetical protein
MFVGRMVAELQLQLLVFHLLVHRRLDGKVVSQEEIAAGTVVVRRDNVAVVACSRRMVAERLPLRERWWHCPLLP